MEIKNKNLFSWIRNQHNSIALFIALFTNLMVFSQPLHFIIATQSQSQLPLGFSNNAPIEKVNNVLRQNVKSTIKQQISETNNLVIPQTLVTTTTMVPDADIILAAEKQGIIGKSENLPIDELTDNIFSFELKQDIKQNKDIYLEYELFGLADGSQVTKNINDALATGGSLIKTTKDWTKVKERVNPNDIQKGKNTIQFTTLENSKYQYMVRNLKIVYEDKSSATEITFHQNTADSYNGLIFFTGFITDNSVQKVTVLDKEFPVIDGVFEVLIDEKTPNASLEVAYLNKSGNKVTNNIKIKELLEKPTEVHKLAKTNAFASQIFQKGRKSSLSFAGAKLVVDSLGLEVSKNFSITGLRYEDLPVMSPEMVNVTAAFNGYKMLPHGNHFECKPAKVHLKYDETKFPTGYTSKDIKTFYFDSELKKWIALDVDTLLTNDKEIVSNTTHFTDFINGIIKVPESPETGSFTPTSIKDIKAADPTAGVVSIAPPTPNNMGTLNTSFALKLPAGRAGMQPSLSVNYSSEGGNGWMGLGWDLSIPGVSLDTRWGAPRYDATNETEIYSMGGGMLTLKDGLEYTNPHRKAGLTRGAADKQFYPRIEGSYAKIIRKGSDPTNYWWEVTDKMGNKSFYGGYGNAVVNNAVIKTNQGNISYWGLYRTEDTNGNYVQYKYHNAPAVIPNQVGNGGNEFYIKEIQYTLHKTETQPTNHYQIDFLRDNDPGQTALNRKDVQVSARNGVVQVTKDLLTRINVGLYQTTTNLIEPIRSYRFEYSEHAGSFFKQQLNTISEYDASGDLFYSNKLDYEKNGADHVTPITNGNFIKASSPWGYTGDNSDKITADLVLPNSSGDFNENASILGSSTSVGFNIGGSLNAGLGFDVWSKLFTAGVNISGSRSKDNGLTMFQDINGDGLPDKIMRDGTQSSYRLNNGSSFGTTKLPIGNLGSFSSTLSTSESAGVEVSAGFFGGYTRNFSDSITTVYMADVNGDGLVDVVDDGTVKFNRVLAVAPTAVSFVSDSAETPNPITAGKINQNLIDSIALKTLAQLDEENPLHDAVKIWKAPRSGTIDITSVAALNPTPMPAANNPDLLKFDGVKLSIQKNTSGFPSSASSLVGISSQAGNSSVDLIPTVSGGNLILPASKIINVNNLAVDKDDRIYFRVQSRFEGSFDKVDWNPNIVYTGTEEEDANGLKYFSSSAAEGFIMSSEAPIRIPKDGTFTSLSGFPITLGQYSADLNFEIEKGTYDLVTGAYVVNNTFRAVYNHLSGAATTNINISDFFDGIIPLAGNLNSLTTSDIFKFKVLSDSNVDWKSINWFPVINYTATGSTPTNEQVRAVVNYGIFNKKINPVISKFTGFNNSPIIVRPFFNMSAFNSLASGNYSFTVVAKNSNKRTIGKQTFIIDNSTSPGNAVLITSSEFEVVNNITPIVFVEIYTDNLNVENIPIEARIFQASNILIQSALLPPTLLTPSCTFGQNKLIEVELNNLTDAGLACPFYENRTLIASIIKPLLIKNSNYSLFVTLKNAGKVAVWVDFIKNNQIGTGELFTSNSNLLTHNIIINIPLSSASDGLTNIRIRGGFSTNIIDAIGFNAIATSNYGTIRDYQINVLSYKYTSTDVYSKRGSSVFGPDYRNWGQFGYHGGLQTVAGVTSNFGTMPIDENFLNNNITTTLPTTNPFGTSCNTPACFQANAANISSGMSSPVKKRFINMYANLDANPNNWTGFDAENFVESAAFSPSRFGTNNVESLLVQITPSIPTTSTSNCLASANVPGITIVSKGNGHSYAGGASFGPISLSGSYSTSENTTLNSYMDMNGDRFPDILVKNNIQFTNPLGTLDANLTAQSFGDVNTSESTSTGGAASGNFTVAKTPAKDSSTVTEYDECGTAISTTVTPATPLKIHCSGSASVNAGSGDSHDNETWNDMNGDGLPDRVTANNGALKVALNLGYGFAPEQNWSSTLTSLEGRNKNYGGGLGFSILDGSFSGGVSTSASNGFSLTNLVDVNGDGLPDYISMDVNNNKVQYFLNTGNGFTNGGTNLSISDAFLNRNRSTGEGINASYTFGVTIFLAKATTTVKAGADQSINRVEATISDINGDGFPDLLEAGQNNNDLKVRLSNIGTANLLKSVTTPTGGSWEVEYERVGNTFDMPQSKYVLSRIKTFDGFTADNNWSDDRTVTSIEYKNPYHDRREREFFGFDKVIVNQHESFNSSIDDYALATSLPAIYRRTEQEFFNRNYYLKGAVKKETLFDAADAIWTQNITTYGLFKPSIPLNSAETLPLGTATFTSSTYNINGLDADNVKYGAGFSTTSNQTNFICTDLDHSSLFVTPLVTYKRFTEGQGITASNKISLTRMEEFDQFGNVKQYRDYGEQGNDTYVSKINYFTSIAGLDNAVAYPEKIQVFDANGTTLKRERRATYNADGNLETVITKLNDSTDPTVNKATVKMTYDTYGNLSRVSHENSINLNSTVNGGKFFRDYTYDPILHTYPTRVEDAFGYFSTSEYSYLFGVPVYTTDMNLQPMRTRLDDRGRPIEITGPYELFVEGITGGTDIAWTIRFEYLKNTTSQSVASILAAGNATIDDDNRTKIYDANDSFVPSSTVGSSLHFALTRHFDPEYRIGIDDVYSTNQILTSTLSDGFGKPVQVKKMFADHLAATAGNMPNDNNNELKWLLPGKVKTDAMGRAIKSYYPTTQAGDFSGLSNSSPAISAVFVPASSFVYDNSADAVTPTLTGDYDPLDRPHTTTLPGESTQTTMDYSIDNNRFKTVVTNELSQVQISYTDVRGRTTETTQESTTGDITTTFNYNNISELMIVKDVANNETRSQYDLAGRRIRLEHQDNGVTKFTYDAASNLIQRQTSNLLGSITPTDAIKYEYTYNRLNKIIYPQNPENNVNYYYGTAGNSDAADNNAVGRLWYHVDATGTQYFEYGKLGELIKNRRSIAVPNDRVYWFQTEWAYDTWNRVKTIKYPDEEVVTYNYNKGGELHSMTSAKNTVANPKDIISQLGYDKFGQRTYLRYGNGTETTYNYEAERRRLNKMKVGYNSTYFTPAPGAPPAPADRTFIDNQYEYDVLSNVKAIRNNLNTVVPSLTQIGGKSWQEFTYDDLNRLTGAFGSFVGRNDNGVGFNHNRYNLAMAYDSQHNITSKIQTHDSASALTTAPIAGPWTQVEKTSYSLDYQDYNTGGYIFDGLTYKQPHAPRKIIDQPTNSGPTTATNDPRIKTLEYEYDRNGNQTKTHRTICGAPASELIRENLWDEENRLRAIDLNPAPPPAGGAHPIAIYTYDAGGERIIKQNSTDLTVYENAEKVGTLTKSDFMLYPSGMVVARLAADGSGVLSYTKHYFAGSQRVSSKIGTTTNLGKFLQDWTLQSNGAATAPINVVLTSHNQLAKAEAAVLKVYTAFGITPPTLPAGNTAFLPVAAFDTGAIEKEQYFFHPDHLGSSNYITNFVGDVCQHMEYFAFGETFVEEHKNSNNSPYKFNGKELDDESGLYYYGARYYDPRISIWASIDPLAEKMPSWSPYSFCFDNPMRYVDPDGQAPTDWYLNLITGNVSWKGGQGSRFGYKNLGHSYGSTDVNGNRFLMDGDSKQISYNGKVLQDFNSNKSAFDITDGLTIWGNDRSGDTSGQKGITTSSIESDDIPTLGNGDGTAGSIFSKVDNILEQVIKFFETVDAAGDTMDRVQGVVTQVQNVKEEANKQEPKPNSTSATDYVRTNFDPKTGSATWVRRDVYDAQQKKE